MDRYPGVSFAGLVRSSGDGLQKEFSDMTGCYCDPETEEGRSKCRQSELDATDINQIVERFERGGVPLPVGENRFLDVSEVPDFRSALAQVQRANEYFAALPAKSRAMFQNDPAAFLDRVNNPHELQLLVDAGVIPADEVKVPEAPEVVAARLRAERKAAAKDARAIARELEAEEPK